MQRNFCLGLIALLGLAPVPALAQIPAFVTDDAVVVASNAWSATAVRSGGEITLAMVLEIRDPFHIGPADARGTVIPTTIQWSEAPAFLRTSTPLFPEPHSIDFGPPGAREKIDVLSGRVVIYLPVAVRGTVAPGKYPVTVTLEYQACDDKQCLLPAQLRQATELTVVDAAGRIENTHGELFTGMKDRREKLKVAFFGLDFRFEPTLGMLLLIAGIGGFLLNLTPCVLPLVPIKIMGLSHAAGNRRRCLVLGVAMSAGVVLFWIGLALAIAGISGFNATNQLFQFPAFTVSVGVLICVMAVGMTGLFSISLPQWVYRFNPSQESIPGSVLFGVMTAVLSTPCTAPFMGAAAAWSATQAPAITITTFAAIGAGMALPYLALSAFPNLARRVPKSGPASELVKQVMGLLMLAAGAYFLGTGLAGLLVRPPDPPSPVYWWAVSLLVAGAGGWLGWRTWRISQRVRTRLIFGCISLCLIGAAGFVGVRFTRGSPVKWVYYTPERLGVAEKQGKVLVLDFTAAWCLNCTALEQAVLHHPEVVRLLNSTNVIPFKIDLTGQNVAGDKKLLETGRRSIPYLVIYNRGGKQVFASDAYTVEQVIRAIEPGAPASRQP